MATETQKRAMDLKIEKIKQKKPKRLVESKGWQELLNTILKVSSLLILILKGYY